MKRGSRRVACTVFVMSALASAATAQTNPVASQPGEEHPSSSRQPETVTVTAQRLTAQQLSDAVIAQFVDQHGARDKKSGQFVRDLGVCPLTLGFPPAFNAFVTARVLAVAASVGARTQEAGKCNPNIEIIYTDEPQKVLNELYRHTRGAILGVHYVHEAKTLIRVTRPVQAWYVTGTRVKGGNGDAVSGQGTPSSPNDADPSRMHMDDAYSRGPEPVGMGSRIHQRLESLIINTLILMDATKVVGQPIGPIADYAAMLALSQPKSLDDCSKLPSILDLMSSGCDARPKPESLTAGDIAYLKALYAADLAASVSRQEDSVTNGMKGDLDGQ
ncbi:MAG TPA: hypothetical protein VII49_09650 [Rhizomicrobium sp.]